MYRSVASALGAMGTEGSATEVTSLSKVAQKAKTRRLLSVAALSLFATQGYDETTVSEVAKAAGVSERTFFLHFPNKADVLVDLSEGLERLVASILASDSAEPDFDVLEECLIEWHEMDADLRNEHRLEFLLLKAGSMSATVRGKLLDANDAIVAAVASALAQRHQLEEPTLVMRVEAAVALRVLHAIVVEWTSLPEPNNFQQIARAHFEALRSIFERNPAPA